jgi:hypothetical protein
MGHDDLFIGNVTDVSEETDASIFRAVLTTPPTNNADKIPDLPARSQSLYRLSYPAHWYNKGKGHPIPGHYGPRGGVEV